MLKSLVSTIRLERMTKELCERCGKKQASDRRYHHIWLPIKDAVMLLCFRCADAEKKEYVKNLDEDNNEIT